MSLHDKFWPKRLPRQITPPATPLWDNVAVNARRFPDKPALVFLGRSTSYRELLAQVTAHRSDAVSAKGVGATAQADAQFSGMIGKVTKVSEGSDEIEVELSDALRVRILKSTLMDVRAKGEPVKETA